MEEEKIRNLARMHYSRPDIQKAIFNFSANREIVPKYLEGFGKRPDSLQYPGDIFEYIKNGVTSFNCSEELWKDPMSISTELNEKQLNELRIGWDLLIDIDCPWFDYSKKAAQSIIKSLKFSGVKNIGIKFSGSKGFHILVPWKSFPKEIHNFKVSDMFPMWPRIIVSYLKEISRPILKNLIQDNLDDFKKISGFTGVMCEKCKNLAKKSYQITVQCKKHKIPHTETFISEEYKTKICPECNSSMDEINKKEVYICIKCQINSLEKPDNFNEEKVSTDIFKILGLDMQLVSQRHLFRMPYSLHEKTGLASVVLSVEELENFDPKDANPLKIKIKNFMPDSEEGEATNLLREALDWYKNQNPEEFIAEKAGFIQNANANREFKPIKLQNLSLSDDMIPPSIRKILQGIKDGKKRSLFVLINFFRAIGLERQEVEKIVSDWNQKNETPLKQNYIKSQFLWSYRNKIVPPPNYDKDYYLGIGISPTEEELKAKNPLSYISRKLSQKNLETENKFASKKRQRKKMSKIMNNI